MYSWLEVPNSFTLHVQVPDNLSNVCLLVNVALSTRVQHTIRVFVVGILLGEFSFNVVYLHSGSSLCIWYVSGLSKLGVSGLTMWLQ